MRYLFLIVLTVIIGFANDITVNGNIKITSFSKAKKLLTKVVYTNKELRSTIYAQCNYEPKKIKKSNGRYSNKLVIDKQSCGYTPKSKSKRANYVEYEHVVPAHAFGGSLACWKKGNNKCINSKGRKYKGRKCCSRVNQNFKLMAADVFNLHPSVGELNMHRSNFTFTELSGETRAYGDVDFEVDFKKRKVEPSEASKGIVARRYFYMSKVYKINISSKQMKLFSSWNKNYPMTDKERLVISKKEKIQGNRFIY